MSFLAFLLKNLLRRKTRTLLTVLGVSVAMATIVTLRGMAVDFQLKFRENFEGRGADLIVTAAGVPDQLRSDLDEHIAPKLEAIEGVARVNMGLVELVDLQRGEGTMSAIINGWTLDAAQFNDLKMIHGRRLEKGDHRKIIIGDRIAEYLNKGVGDTLEIQRQSFAIIGVYQSFTGMENSGAVMPLAELQSLMHRVGSVTGFSIVLAPGYDKKEILEQVKHQIELLTDDEGQQYRITAQTTAEYVNKALPVKLAQGMAWVTSTIALLIGTISMLNTMIMSVMERTKEIGILRAIGWRMRRVVFMILGEALLLSLAAMVVGSVVAVFAMRWLARMPETVGAISGDLAPIVLVEGLVMTAIVAILGGSYPAYRAARWLPSEALRHE
jgi:putative ABC transport system permease protein